MVVLSSSRQHDAVRAEGIRFAYGDGLAALNDVSFRAARGEFVALVGSNGSGKTTLLKIILRILQPQAGRVFIDDLDSSTMPAEDLYRRVGMVFQNPSDQLFAATVEQDIAFGPRNLGLGEDEIARRVDAALAAVDAQDLRDRPIHHLSFGEQKRACLAGVLAMQPSILVLDEPTAGLDPLCEAHMIELLTRLNREQNITMILSTHSMDLLPVLADRVYVLRKGHVLREGSPREILADHDSALHAGLRLPLISQLFHELSRRDGLDVGPLPLTVEQARRQVLAMLADPTRLVNPTPRDGQ